MDDLPRIARTLQTIAVRNYDGSYWDWRKAGVRAALLAAGSTYGFHHGFGYAWLTSALIIAGLFATGGLLWFWAYSRQRG